MPKVERKECTRCKHELDSMDKLSGRALRKDPDVKAFTVDCENLLVNPHGSTSHRVSAPGPCRRSQVWEFGLTSASQLEQVAGKTAETRGNNLAPCSRVDWIVSCAAPLFSRSSPPTLLSSC